MYNSKTCGKCGTIYDRGTGFGERKCPTCSMPKHKSKDERIDRLEEEIEKLKERIAEISS